MTFGNNPRELKLVVGITGYQELGKFLYRAFQSLLYLPINPMSSIEDKDINKGLFSVTLSEYWRNWISLPDSISISLSYIPRPSTTNCIFGMKKIEFFHVICPCSAEIM